MHRVDADAWTWKAIREYDFLKHITINQDSAACWAPKGFSPYTRKHESKPQPEKGWLVPVVWVFWELLTDCTLQPTCPAETSTSSPATCSSYRIKWTLWPALRSIYSRMFTTNPMWRFSNCNQIHPAKNWQSWWRLWHRLVTTAQNI